MPNAHAAEARKLDRLVFGENGHGGAVRVTADAAQRVQNGSRKHDGVSDVIANPFDFLVAGVGFEPTTFGL